MKRLLARDFMPALMIAQALAADAPATTHRYVIERTFPIGALTP